MKKYNAFILAGARAPWLLPLAGTEHLPLADLAGRRLLDYILTALRESGRIGKIVIAALPEVREKLEGTLPDGIFLCAAQKDMPSTALAAANALGAEGYEKLLSICIDIPLLTAAAVNFFLDECEKYPEKEAFYTIIPKEECLAAFPEAKRTYVTLPEGIFTGGNMVLITYNAIATKQGKAQEIYARRKSPLGLCNWLGWFFILKFIFRRLTLGEIENRTTSLLGFACKAVITPYAGVGMDIDKESDWLQISAYLKKAPPAV